MSRSSPLTKKDEWTAKYQNPTGSRFEIWEIFLNNSDRFFKQELKEIGDAVNSFNSIHSEKSGITGIEQYHDTISEVAGSMEKALPLAFIGAFNDFEKYFKRICIEIRGHFGDDREKDGKFKYIDGCRKYLNHKNIITITKSPPLDELWKKNRCLQGIEKCNSS